jgi:hypothetical protein
MQAPQPGISMATSNVHYKGIEVLPLLKVSHFVIKTAYLGTSDGGQVEKGMDRELAICKQLEARKSGLLGTVLRHGADFGRNTGVLDGC